jgi:hypothetical protein
MKSILKTGLIALVAVFAFGALAGTSAWAELPEFVLKEKSQYPVVYQVTGKGIGLTLHGSNRIECTSGTGEVSFINSKEVTGSMKWGSCFGSGWRCGNEHHEAIKTEPLKGTLSYINKSKTEVGLRLEGPTRNGSPIWAEGFTCVGGGPEPIKGKLVGLIARPNIKTTSFDLSYKEGLKFEGGALNEYLTWDEGEKFLVNARFTLSTAASMEIRA